MGHSRCQNGPVNGKAPGQGDLRLATSSGTLDWGYGCERPGHLLMRRLTICSKDASHLSPPPSIIRNRRRRSGAVGFGGAVPPYRVDFTDRRNR